MPFFFASFPTFAVVAGSVLFDAEGMPAALDSEGVSSDQEEEEEKAGWVAAAENDDDDGDDDDGPVTHPKRKKDYLCPHS